MRTQWRNDLIVRLIPVLLPLLLGSVCFGETKQTPTLISYKDLSTSVQITGKLGRPLGQLVVIRGRWTDTDRSKPVGPVFVVEELNGKSISPAVTFSSANVQPVSRNSNEPKFEVGQHWELRGVETGYFSGFSEAVWKEVGDRPAQIHGFVVEFCYVVARRIDKEPSIQK